MPEPSTIYSVENYSFGTKDAQPEEDASIAARLARLESHYTAHGCRSSVEAILVVHEHGHPHILMFQIANTFFKLPGHYVRPGEDERNGLARILTGQLSADGYYHNEIDAEWSVSEEVARWWRPGFETFMYPYVPAHITRPKEVKKLFIVNLPRQKMLYVPKNMKILAVPLLELYDNAQRYGPQLAALPLLLSRIDFKCA